MQHLLLVYFPCKAQSNDGVREITHQALLVVLQRPEPEGDVRDIAPRVEEVEGEYKPRAAVVSLEHRQPCIPAATSAKPNH